MCMAYTLLEPHGHRADEIGKDVQMDRHVMNLRDTGIRFLSLKPRLLSCIKLTMIERKT